MKKPEILFILPVPAHPRFNKRISGYLEAGYIVRVASFERTHLSKNKLPDELTYLSLGLISDYAYISRLPILIKAFFLLRRICNNNTDIYLMAQEFLPLALFLKRRRMIYEIGDIRDKNSPVIQLIINIWYKLIRSADTIVVTSQKFKNYYIDRADIGTDKIVVVENKLSLKDFPLEKQPLFKKITGDSLVIGVVGMFRYENIIWFLDAFQRAQPSFKIFIFGGGRFKHEVSSFANKQNIMYYGEYKNPDDLHNIYPQISLSFVMYDNKSLNVRLAVPNKLYESMYFRKPLLVSGGTYLAERVQEYNIGFVWDQNKMDELIAYLGSDRFINEYNQMEGSFEKLNHDDYFSMNNAGKVTNLIR